jgi:hypothetical protein
MELDDKSREAANDNALQVLPHIGGDRYDRR